MTRSEVEWLKQDSKETLERAKGLPALTTETPLGSELPEGTFNKEELLEVERSHRQMRLATAIKLVVNGALNRSKWCGVFLGDIIPFLARKEPELMANEQFKRRISELRSAQKARKQGRTLRTEIEEIIQEARSQRHLHDTFKGERLLPDARKYIRDLERRARLLKKEGFNVRSCYRFCNIMFGNFALARSNVAPLLWAGARRLPASTTLSALLRDRVIL